LQDSGKNAKYKKNIKRLITVNFWCIFTDLYIKVYLSGYETEYWEWILEFAKQISHRNREANLQALL